MEPLRRPRGPPRWVRMNERTHRPSYLRAP
jgi:hypothetical protein